MIRKNLNNLNKKRSLGQGMTEYIIIVGVIAIAAIGTFGYFGDVMQNQAAGMAQELSGSAAGGGAERLRAQGFAGNATRSSAAHKTLGNYDQNSQTAAGGN